MDTVEKVLLAVIVTLAICAVAVTVVGILFMIGVIPNATT